MLLLHVSIDTVTRAVTFAVKERKVKKLYELSKKDMLTVRNSRHAFEFSSEVRHYLAIFAGLRNRKNLVSMVCLVVNFPISIIPFAIVINCCECNQSSKPTT